MNTSNIKLRWVYAAVIGAFPVVGLICSAVYRDLSMFWVSLLFLVGAAVIFPVGFILAAIFQRGFSVVFAAMFIFVSETIKKLR
jgi:hypothetical protein